MIEKNHHYHLGPPNPLDLYYGSSNTKDPHPGSQCALVLPLASSGAACPDAGLTDGGTGCYGLLDPDLWRLDLRSPGRLAPPHPACYLSPCACNWVSHQHCTSSEPCLKGRQPRTRASVLPRVAHSTSKSDPPFTLSVQTTLSFDKPEPSVL